MLLLDDILLAPLHGFLWICRQIHEGVERESLDEAPLHQALLETELALEEGRITADAYQERLDRIMTALRAIKAQRRAQDEGEPPVAVGGDVSLEIDVDLEHYGPAAAEEA